MKTLLWIIAVSGLMSMLLAISVSQAIYVQANVIKKEFVSDVSRTKVDSLSKNSDTACLLFGILGAIQFGCGLYCSRRIEKIKTIVAEPAH